MEMNNVLVSFTYYTYCQGSKDRNFGYKLLAVPFRYSFEEIKTLLMQAFDEKGEFEIVEDTIENETLFYNPEILYK